MSFTQRHGIGRVSRHPAGVTNLWVDGRAGGAEAESHVAKLIHRDTAHPAPGRVRLIGAFLEGRNRTSSDAAQFKPADAGNVVRVDRPIADQRLVVAKVAVSEAEHQTVTEVAKVVRSCHTKLRNEDAEAS